MRRIPHSIHKLIVPLTTQIAGTRYLANSKQVEYRSRFQGLYLRSALGRVESRGNHFASSFRPPKIKPIAFSASLGRCLHVKQLMLAEASLIYRFRSQDTYTQLTYRVKVAPNKLQVIGLLVHTCEATQTNSSSCGWFNGTIPSFVVVLMPWLLSSQPTCKLTQESQVHTASGGMWRPESQDWQTLSNKPWATTLPFSLEGWASKAGSSDPEAIASMQRLAMRSDAYGACFSYRGMRCWPG